MSQIPEFLLKRIEEAQHKSQLSAKTDGLAAECEKQVAMRVTCEFVIEQLAKADNSVFAILVAEMQGTRKKKDERDTEFIKRLVRNYNQLLIGQLVKDFLS